MKRQAIVITLEMLEEIKKEINKAIESLEKLGIDTKDKEKLGFQYNIINYPSQWGNRKVYMSDTWQFEGIENETRRTKKKST